MLKERLPPIILGSASPRRRELLSQLGLQFKVIKPDVEEKRQPGETPQDYVIRNGILKASWVSAQLNQSEDQLIICADTIVVRQGKVYEKPADTAGAVAMLSELAGQTHTVYTGMVVQRTGPQPQLVSRLVSTEVKLKSLPLSAIQAYVQTGEPLDKAGSYAIQGLGAFMVEEIHGSYSNVVGLPLSPLIDLLESDLRFKLWA